MHRRLSRVGRGDGVAGLGRLFGALNRREQVVPLTITRAQRDAIYELVVTHLTGIGDVWSSVQGGDFASAKRLGRDFAEDLRLLEDLGWAETIDRETVALSLPPDELTRTLARLHRDAAGSLGAYVSRPKDDEELAQRDLAASQALGEILGQLARPADGQQASRLAGSARCESSRFRGASTAAWRLAVCLSGR
jgi:hypothetical protein